MSSIQTEKHSLEPLSRQAEAYPWDLRSRFQTAVRVIWILGRAKALNGPTQKAVDNSLLFEAEVQSKSELKWFDGVENACERRRGCRGYSGFVSVVDVVIAAVQQIQKFA